MPESRYYYIKSLSQLRSEKTLLKMQAKLKEDEFRVQWDTLKEFVSFGNLRMLVEEKLAPLRSIASIASTAFRTIMSLMASRRSNRR